MIGTVCLFCLSFPVVCVKCQTHQAFLVSWSSGFIRLVHDMSVILKHDDTKIPVKSVSIRSGFGAEGEYRFLFHGEGRFCRTPNAYATMQPFNSFKSIQMLCPVECDRRDDCTGFNQNKNGTCVLISAGATDVTTWNGIITKRCFSPN